MNWKLINKDARNQPTHGTYSDWKEQIASECYNQCVYCSIHEAQFGGIDHYHIDHFKPKSKFPEHIEDIHNLFYACPICNRFKSDDWPAEPDLNATSYIDPSKINYKDLFEVSDTYEIVGKYVASKYIAIRLYLNRAQLIFERRESFKRNQVKELQNSINDLLSQISQIDTDLALIILETTKVYGNLLALEQLKREIRPYKTIDIRKS